MVDEFELAVEEIAPVVQALIMSSGDVLAMRPPDQKAIARQLAEGGLRLDAGKATHRWAGVDGLASGVWTPLEHDPIDDPVPDISGLSLAQKTALLQQLQAQGLGGGDTPPDLPAGAEVHE